ncbi:MAG TPA: type II secretion system F family protein, partial [bacterium]|nr:type II secretion system F family protein [bacterium]
MGVFIYTGLNPKGKRITGEIEGKDIKNVKKILKENGIFVINLKEKKGEEKFSIPLRVKTEDIAISIRELATLINSGVPLDEGLTSLISQMRDGKLKSMYEDIQKRIREGKSFSEAISRYPQYFSEMMVSMVKAGEESGTLDLILFRISNFLEKKISFRNKILGIMTYPILMSIVALLVIIFIFTFVSPTITRIFNEISLTLPLPTIILMKISNFFKNFWFVVFPSIIVIFLSFKKLIPQERKIQFIDKIRMGIPFLRDIFIKGEIVNFTRTLSTLLDGGVEILESLKISEKVIYSPLIKREVENIREFLSKGGSLSSGFKKSKFFPYIVTQLIDAGEKSGNLPEMIDKIANIYEEEITHKSTFLIRLIEPGMIL